MATAFAVMHTWPELRNAEYEVLQRILGAATNAGRPAVVINNSGVVIWADRETGLRTGALLKAEDVAFVISLHFESPRLLDIYSYYTLWQPLDFYYDFGYQKSVDKFSSHNDLVSCDSDIADAHALNVFTGLGRVPEQPLPRMFHMLPEPYLEPDISAESRLFYIGINWERLGRPKGRFHDTLSALDERGLTVIYGPELFHGVAPWGGFKTYEGELPFDGQSVKRAINRAGICLALSSGPHKRSGIMSNRLFEGFAGGAAVIATPNPLIDKYFRDVVYLVDDSRGEAVLGQSIIEAMRQIRSDTKEATRRVAEGQRILKEQCSLEGSISSLFLHHERRVKSFEDSFLESAEITVLLIDDHGVDSLLKARLKELQAQKLCRIDVHVVCERSLVSELSAEEPGGAIQSICWHGVDFTPTASRFEGMSMPSERSGPVVGRILGGLTTPLFAFLSSKEALFRDHFASLVKALHAQPGAKMACSGALRQTRDLTAGLSRSLVELRWANDNAIILVNGPAWRGRFLFDASLAAASTAPLLDLLDGEEARYFQLAGLLAGPLAQSNYATYLLDEADVTPSRVPAIPIEHQQQCVRDLFARDARWLDRLARGVGIPEFVYAYAPGTPIRWADFGASRTRPMPIEVGRLLPLRQGGEGLAYVVSGFSYPEPEISWISSSRAILSFELPQDVIDRAGDFDLVVVALGRRSLVTGREQHCLVAINGMTCAYLPVPDSRVELKIRIPRDLLATGPGCQVEVIPDHLEPVEAVGVIRDERYLSMAIFSFGIVPVIGKKKPPVLIPGRLHGCGLAELGAEALVRGFFDSEVELTWMAGVAGELRFRTSRPVKRPLLKLRVWGRPSETGEPQSATLRLNGHDMGTFELATEFRTLEMPLPIMEPEEVDYNLAVRIHHAETVNDEEGKAIDSRLLGLAFSGLGIFEQLPPNEPYLKDISIETSLDDPKDNDCSSLVADDADETLQPSEERP